MKPPKFHVGQAVARASSRCPCDPGHEHVPDITKGRILHVAGMEWLGHYGKPDWYIWFDEIPFPNAYNEHGFVAVEELPDEALAALLEETLEPVTV